MRLLGVVLPLALCVLLGSACGTDRPDVAETVPTLALSGSPLLRIDSASTPIHQVVAALRRPDGSILVANGGSKSLLRFGADGRLAGEDGRAGEGPGEFRRISWMDRGAGDTVLVYDGALGRLSRWTPGGHVSAVPLQRIAGRAGLVPIGRLADGSLLTQAHRVQGPVRGIQRDALIYSQYGPDGRLLRDLFTLEGDERFVELVGEGGSSGRLQYDLPFGRRRAAEVWNGRIISGDGTEADVLEHTPGGAVGARIRTPFQPREVAAADRDSSRAFFLSFATDDAGRRAIEQQVENIPLAPRVPAYGALMVDGVGRLWVGEYPMPGRSPRRWAVLNEEGDAIGTLSVPEGFVPLDAGEDYVLGVARDAETDEESVVLYGLRPQAR